MKRDWEVKIATRADVQKVKERRRKRPKLRSEDCAKRHLEKVGDEW